ncbi:integrase core domain [Plakobranchus ocellatus]|uniref:Integrase core domain n=1 Tax=Plakobranchus ocellatus TaxID=259542 RepID=A0AAV4D4F7_9GAST|nr:integrase core domain [Plakobranchus ocellatus]
MEFLQRNEGKSHSREVKICLECFSPALSSCSVFSVEQQLMKKTSGTNLAARTKKTVAARFVDEVIDVDHTTSSPRYPQSNGFAERMVQTAKKLIAKSKEDPHIALLNYRTSPSQNLPSPAELLMGSKLRTKLPSLKSHHQTKNSQQELKQMKENQRQQRKHHRGFDLQLLEAGDDVFMRNQAETHWTPAKVVKKAI